ncbi:hypothetical protein CR513_53431, partial [Mucuna pruriens]
MTASNHITTRQKDFRSKKGGARNVGATENRTGRKENLTEATRTCGQESKPRSDVAPDSGLNGSKSYSWCLH